MKVEILSGQPLALAQWRARAGRYGRDPRRPQRFIVCHNPDAADRDAVVRTNLITRLEAMIAGSDRLPQGKGAELRGVISTKPELNR